VAPDGAGDRHPWIERAERDPGKNHLHAAAQRVGVIGIETPDVAAFVRIVPDVGRLKPTSARPVVDLPTTGLATSDRGRPFSRSNETSRRHVWLPIAIPQAALTRSAWSARHLHDALGRHASGIPPRLLRQPRMPRTVDHSFV